MKPNPAKKMQKTTPKSTEKPKSSTRWTICEWADDNGVMRRQKKLFTPSEHVLWLILNRLNSVLNEMAIIRTVLATDRAQGIDGYKVVTEIHKIVSGFDKRLSAIENDGNKVAEGIDAALKSRTKYVVKVGGTKKGPARTCVKTGKENK